MNKRVVKLFSIGFILSVIAISFFSSDTFVQWASRNPILNSSEFSEYFKSKQLASTGTQNNTDSDPVNFPPRFEEPIPGKYIVVLKNSSKSKGALSRERVLGKEVDTEDFVKGENANNRSFKVDKVFKKALKGFSANLSDEEVADLKADPQVAYVVSDRKMYVQQTVGQTVPNGINRAFANNLVDNGTGVHVAVVDTGINSSHPDLIGRVAGGVNCIDTSQSFIDDNGHGTHVSGTIAANHNSIGVVGVAPKATLWSVKVLGASGSGSFATAICGLDFIADMIGRGTPIKVVNMSLAGPGRNDNNCGLTDDNPLHQAICVLRDLGVTVVVAAGNSIVDKKVNSSDVIPAAFDDAVITVSALADSDGKPGYLGVQTGYGSDDYFASFSNYGSAIDIGAPGANILSTSISGGYSLKSGTSMAAPHVSGAAALYIQKNPNASWDEVLRVLTTQGFKAGATTHVARDDYGIVHLESVLKVRQPADPAITLTAPLRNPYVASSSPLTISWSLSNTPPNSQVVIYARNIKLEPITYPTLLSTRVKGQSGVLTVGTSTGSFRMSLDYLKHIPGQYEVYAQVRECSPSGCATLATSTSKLHAVSNLRYFYFYNPLKIFMLSPKVGEVWESGVSNVIDFIPHNSVVNPLSDVDVYLEQKNIDGSFKRIGIIPTWDESEDGDLIYWDGQIVTATTTKFAVPGEYFFRVRNSVTGVSDRSNSSFILKKYPLDLKINGSNGPLTVVDNQLIKISWNVLDAGSCTLHGGVRLVQGGPEVQDISIPPTPGNLTAYVYAPSTEIVIDPPRALTIICKRPQFPTSSWAYIILDVVELLLDTRPPSLSVVSPNGGVAIQLGKQRLITWKEVNMSKISIALYKDNRWLQWIARDISTLDSDTASYTWIPKDGAITEPSRSGEGSVFKISIVGQKANGSGNISDKSDTTFSFSPAVSKTPVITRLDAPVSVRVGQVGTWVVYASVPDSTEQISYSVVWGDEAHDAAVSTINTSGSFAHVYSNSGIYTPRFTIFTDGGRAETVTQVNVLP